MCSQKVIQILWIYVLILLQFVIQYDCIDNGLALTPPMGYNTWNSFGCHINETVVKANVDLIVSSGLKDAGYIYFNLDDCWHAPERVHEGLLTWDPAKFPSGIPALAEYIHSKGLLFGMYSDSGYYTCQHYPGSYGFEEIDAQTFASWGVDYLKYDNCFVPQEEQERVRYERMSKALNNTGRPIVFSICEWGNSQPNTWAPQIGNSWRTTVDISPDWLQIMSCLDGTIGLSEFARPGAWNDPDMLEVGNILSKYPDSAHKAHFVVWAILKSPLIIGADLTQIKKEHLDILKMKEVISVNQDPMGVAGDLIKKQGYLEVYAAPLINGSRAVVFLNRNEVGGKQLVSVQFEDLGYSKIEPVNIRNLCQEKNIGVFYGSFSIEVDSLDAEMIKITPLKYDKIFDDWRPWNSGFFGTKPPPIQYDKQTGECQSRGTTGAQEHSASEGFQQ